MKGNLSVVKKKRYFKGCLRVCYGYIKAVFGAVKDVLRMFWLYVHGMLKDMLRVC